MVVWCVICDVCVLFYFLCFIMNGSSLDVLGVVSTATLLVHPCQHVEASINLSITRSGAGTQIVPHLRAWACRGGPEYNASDTRALRGRDARPTSADARRRMA